jgi:hypothetical protein
MSALKAFVQVCPAFLSGVQVILLSAKSGQRRLRVGQSALRLYLAEAVQRVARASQKGLVISL